MRRTKAIKHVASSKTFVTYDNIALERRVITPKTRYASPFAKFDKAELDRYIKEFGKAQKQTNYKNYQRQQYEKEDIYRANR